MVKRVYGTVNGEDIVFSYKGGDRWETTVPSNENGEWIVALWAEDDAGNTAYVCKMLFAISGEQMHLYILPTGYSMVSPEISDFSAKFVESLCKSGIAERMGFTFSLQKERRFTIGNIICSRDSG